MSNDNKSITDDLIMTIAERVNEVRKDVQDVKVTMARNTSSLEEHMRRTEILERQIEPLRSHVTMVNGILKFIGFLAVIGGIIDMVVRLVLK